MQWLQTLATEFAISIGDASVWAGIGIAIFVAAVLWLIGWSIARLVGLVSPGAPIAEAIGVGLACGSIVVTAWWAMVASGGRSSFAPIGFAFVIVIAVAACERRRAGDSVIEAETPPTKVEGRRTSSLLAAAGVVAALSVVGLLYASTLTLSPRDDVQPLEFMDQAFYSILAADVAATGTENVFSPAGFDQIDGLPAQTWYHWGEIWMAAAVISSIDVEPLAARHFVVLPVLLVTTALLGGTLVRRLADTTSRPALFFGAAACVVLAPIPLFPGPYFSSWAVGLLFGITQYGMAAVIVLLAIYCTVIVRRRRLKWAVTGFVATVYASLLPVHVVIALLAAVGVAGALASHALTSTLRTGQRPTISAPWVRVFGWSSVTLGATLAWGTMTGHGLGGNGASPTVEPFNEYWRDSLIIVTTGAWAFVAIPVAWLLVRRRDPFLAAAYVATALVTVVGALIWGARLGDFNMFHFFFGGLALIATPLAAVAVWSVVSHTRRANRRLVGVIALTLCVVQLELAAAHTLLRLQRFGPGDYAPVPVALLEAIKALPADAKVAYACRPLEEIAVWDARLLAVSAHTGRRVIPMCFQADFFAYLNGGQCSPDIISPLFASAPQRRLYPDAEAVPTADEILEFMDRHGIEYLLADDVHPNTLVPGAPTIFSSANYVLAKTR